MREASAFHFKGAGDQAPVVDHPLALIQTGVRVPNDTGPVNELLSAISRDLDADGVLAIWHPHSAEPEVLASIGPAAFQSAFQADFIRGRSELLHQRNGGARSYWRTLGESDEFGALIAALPVDTGTVFISVFYSRVERGTRMRASEAIARIVPFVHPFFRSWSARLTLESSLAGMTAAINGSGVSAVLVDRDGHLLFANTAATKLFEIGDGLRTRGRLILGGSLADTMKLSAAIDHVITPPLSLAGPANRVVLRLDRSVGHPLIVTVTATEDAVDDRGAVGAIIYIIDPDRDVRALISPICKLYGMSPVEIRLACELAMGRSLTDAACEIRVREATARSYLKQLFLKTATHRQVELVRLLVGGAVGLTPTECTPSD